MTVFSVFSGSEKKRTFGQNSWAKKDPGFSLAVFKIENSLSRQGQNRPRQKHPTHIGRFDQKIDRFYLIFYLYFPFGFWYPSILSQFGGVFGPFWIFLTSVWPLFDLIDHFSTSLGGGTPPGGQFGGTPPHFDHFLTHFSGVFWETFFRDLKTKGEKYCFAKKRRKKEVKSDPKCPEIVWKHPRFIPSSENSRKTLDQNRFSVFFQLFENKWESE